MKILTEPEVWLLSQPQFMPHPQYQIPPHDRPAESLIATAGKVCYDSYGLDGNPVKAHIENLVRSGHHSVVEHVHVGLFFAGISRGCSHEIVRHRMFNYSQRSTRYTAEGDANIVLDPFYARMYNPKAANVSMQPFIVERFLRSCSNSMNDYNEQVKLLQAQAPEGMSARDLRKWCRGKARQLLPHALETRMVMTGNLRAWRHFLLMRTNRGAEAEIRRLADRVFMVLNPIAPTVFEDLRKETYDNYIELTA